MKLLPLHFSCGPFLEKKEKQEVLIRSTCQHTNSCSLPAGQLLEPPRDSMQSLLLKTRQNPEVQPSCRRGAEKRHRPINNYFSYFLQSEWLLFDPFALVLGFFNRIPTREGRHIVPPPPPRPPGTYTLPEKSQKRYKFESPENLRWLRTQSKTPRGRLHRFLRIVKPRKSRPELIKSAAERK